MNVRPGVATATAVLLGACATPPSPAPSTPCLHSHNDYLRRHPLRDALEHGCCSIEADVLFVRGRLMVGHDRWTLVSGRTLESAYLAPLAARARGHGGPRDSGPSRIWLLVDFKTPAAPTYAALRPLLSRYRDILTRYRGNETQWGFLSIVLSGNRPPPAVLAREPERLAALDGRLEDLERTDLPPPSLMPWISDSFARISRWRGRGPMPEADRERLRRAARRAHAHGRLFRLWGCPNRPAVWRELLRAGVDLLNVDDLEEGRAVLGEFATGGR